MKVIHFSPVFQAKEMGLVMHMRTLVFVKGAAAATKLKSNCATCPVYLSVTRNVPYSLLVSIPSVDRRSYENSKPCVI